MRNFLVLLASAGFASAGAWAATSAAPPNYDAAAVALDRAAHSDDHRFARLNVKLHQALSASHPLKSRHYPSSYDARLGTATFLWAPPALRPQSASRALAYSPVQPAQRAETAARDVLRGEASYLRLDRSAIDNARLTEVHDLGRGPIIVRFKQYRDGIEVFGRALNVMLDRNLSPVATSGNFAPAPLAAPKARGKQTDTAPPFALDAPSAIARAFSDLSGRSATPALLALGKLGDFERYAARRSRADYHLDGLQRAKKVYYPLDGQYLPAWFVEVHATTIDHANNDVYGYVISAADGRVLLRKNLTNEDAYGYSVFAAASAPFQPEDEPIGSNTLDPFTGDPNGDQGRNPSPFNLVSLTNSGLLGLTSATSAAANDPWLPPGATTTTGNNVVAFANLVGDDGFDDPGDLRGAVSSANTFDYPYTIDTDPTTASQRQAAIVNQFFVDNWLHDFWYDHGLTEAAGNAQADNYGRGGVEGDPIQAQAQDDSGRNNANMSTPPDGGSPIQRMFLWDGPQLSTSTLTITQPASIGTLQFGTAAYGPRNFDVTADVALMQDSGGATDGCNPAANDLSGKIALVDRGACTFKTKTLNAQNAGAVGVIVADNRSEPPIGLGDDSSITDTINIGTLSITQSDGATLKTALGGGTVTAHMKLAFAPDRDGTMDIQIIAHEFFHYVSNRLVGDALGLNTQQAGGMGEGWSDFDAMLLTVRPEDQAVNGNDHYQGAYPLSLYVTAPQYFGIRRYPYSTDLSVDPLTFKDIADHQALPSGVPVNGDPSGADNSEVHNTGEVWCTALWEIYAALLNDPRYNFAQARSRMQDYIIEGLKMTPVNPTMLEARDALLAAARATDAGDYALMAQAFAKRGMGVDAVGPDRADPSNGDVANPDVTHIRESNVALAAGVEVSDAKLDFSGLPDASHLGDTDGDGVLDAGETARLTFTFVNNGTSDMSAPVTGTVTASTPDPDQSIDVTLANGGAVTVPSLKIGETAQVSLLVTLNQATTAQDLALTLAFPQANDPQSGTFPADGSGIAALGAEFDTVVNYDEQPASALDDVSDVLANQHDWTLDEDDSAGSGPGWQIADTTGLFVDQQTSGNAWFGPDNDHPSDIRLVTPPLVVGTTDFTVAFDHFFAFELAGPDAQGNVFGYDGGVIELSQDGGQTWTDVFDPAIGAQLTRGSGYNGYVLSLHRDGSFDPTDGCTGPGTDPDSCHAGFVDANEDPNNPVLEHLVLDFGTAFAGKTVRLRFRETSDEASAVLGWVVDNIEITGITNLPFSATVDDAGASLKNPIADAGPDQTREQGKLVTLDGSGSSDPYQGTLSYAWTQTAGPPVTLSDASAVMPSFKADKTGTYTFSLSVTDQYGHTSDQPDTVNVKVTPAPGGGGFAPGLLLAGLAAAVLRRRRSR